MSLPPLSGWSKLSNHEKPIKKRSKVPASVNTMVLPQIKGAPRYKFLKFANTQPCKSSQNAMQHLIYSMSAKYLLVGQFWFMWKNCYHAYGAYLIGFDNARVITLAHKIHIFSTLFLWCQKMYFTIKQLVSCIVRCAGRYPVAQRKVVHRSGNAPVRVYLGNFCLMCTNIAKKNPCPVVWYRNLERN